MNFTNEELLLLKKIVDRNLINGGLLGKKIVSLSKKIDKAIKN